MAASSLLYALGLFLIFQQDAVFGYGESSNREVGMQYLQDIIPQEKIAPSVIGTEPAITMVSTW